MEPSFHAALDQVAEEIAAKAKVVARYRQALVDAGTDEYDARLMATDFARGFLLGIGIPPVLPPDPSTDE